MICFKFPSRCFYLSDETTLNQKFYLSCKLMRINEIKINNGEFCIFFKLAFSGFLEPICMQSDIIS